MLLVHSVGRLINNIDVSGRIVTRVEEQLLDDKPGKYSKCRVVYLIRILKVTDESTEYG